MFLEVGATIRYISFRNLLPKIVNWLLLKEISPGNLQYQRSGASYSLKFGNWVYVHAGFTTVSGLSAGNDLTMLIGSGAMQTINNIAAISDKGEIGVFRVNETNLQADGTIPSGHAFILDLIIPLQS